MACCLHHHHHVPVGLGVFPVAWSSRWSWSLHLFLGLLIFLRPFGLYCSACFGILFVSILCTCCSYFSFYSFISSTMFCAPFFPWYIDSFPYLVLLFPVTVSKTSSVLFLTLFLSFLQYPSFTSKFNAALAVILWILNFVACCIH